MPIFNIEKCLVQNVQNSPFFNNKQKLFLISQKSAIFEKSKMVNLHIWLKLFCKHVHTCIYVRTLRHICPGLWVCMHVYTLACVNICRYQWHYYCYCFRLHLPLPATHQLFILFKNKRAVVYTMSDPLLDTCQSTLYSTLKRLTLAITAHPARNRNRT